MLRLLKATSIALLLALSGLASYLAYYDLTIFQPALTRTRQLMHSSPSVTVPPLLERDLQYAYAQTLEFQAAKILLRQSTFGGGDGWRAFLWGKLVELHLGKPEQLAVVIALAYMGSDHYGFNSASLAMYAKPIEQLSPTESATLVALMHAPSYYESRPEMLLKRRDQLLTKADNHAF